VEREMPVARSTSAMPPWPMACASVAAHTRRDRSVNTGASARYFDRNVANCMEQHTAPRPEINQLFPDRP
jgi:hypothetical protein